MAAIVTRLAAIAAICATPTLAMAIAPSEGSSASQQPLEQSKANPSKEPTSEATKGTGTLPGSTTNESGAQGTTSGPASGSPTTLGTGGVTTGSPLQLQGIKDQSSSVKRETQGSGSSQEPFGSAGQPGQEGNKSGPAPKR
jgi:hypothetical protein